MIPDRMNETRLKEIYPQGGFTRNGFFGHLFNALSGNLPLWLQTLDRALSLDRAFLGRFGRQVISPMVEGYLQDNALSDGDAAQLSLDVYAIHAYQWERKYNLLSLEYNPIHNYDMTETENVSNETSGNTSHTSTGGGYESTQQSATGNILETVREDGTRTVAKDMAGTEKETLTKSGTETQNTSYEGTATKELEYAGQRTNTTTLAGSTRTIESWNSETGSPNPNLQQTQTVTEGGTETANRDVYGFNSDSYEPANKETRGFDNRTTSTSITTMPKITETANRDRSDTVTERFTDRTDTETQSFDGRQDNTSIGFQNRKDETERTFTNRKDTETESFQGRLTTNTRDDSGHTVTVRRDDNLTQTDTGETSGESSTERTLTRKGNIGVTTSQQMAQSEIALWQWNFYYDVFADVRGDLSCGAY